MRFILPLLLLLGADTKPAFEPSDHYAARQIEGWTVRVHVRLLDDKKELGEQTLKLLSAKLHEINRAVPKAALERLHGVPIWVEAESAKVKCMCYHPSREWLAGHGFNPDKAGGVEIGNPDTFLSWTKTQPAMVLHELAHAYHHQVLGYDNAEVRRAYRQAMDANSYESVLYADGTKKRAYACNNDQEYFAELTEAYFGTNDFYPFVRAEVLQHDPAMHKLLKKLWDSPPATAATSRPASQPTTLPRGADARE
jgi:hypothetical protein